MAEARPYRIFLSGNCQMQFVYDALRRLCRDTPEIALSFRASYRAMRAGDDEDARRCDVHVTQVANLAGDPWRALVPASARRIRVPALALPGVFHVFAPRVHPGHEARGRPPFYLARGNAVLNDLVAQRRAGAPPDALTAAYLDYRGAEIENAPRLWDMNIAAMRRLGAQADFDPWRAIEPSLRTRRHFWSVKHPTRATAMLLLRPVVAMLGLPADAAALDALASAPEYHEPYHAPVHPRLGEILGLDWAGPATRYRFFQHELTAGEHARLYIGGDFRHEFALNRAIQLARGRTDPGDAAPLFRASLSRFPENGQADFWYGVVLYRQERFGLAAHHFRRARDGAAIAPHDVPHRADVTAAAIEAWLKRCRRKLRPAAGTMKARLERLEAEEARLAADIRRLDARRRLTALRAGAA